MTIILTLCFIGLLAILAEIVLPGGVLGVIGALCLIGAVIAIFVSHGATAGLLASVALLVLGVLAIAAWMRWFHRLPFTRALVLQETAGNHDAPASSMIGRDGLALTDLMPSGRAEIGGEKSRCDRRGKLDCEGKAGDRRRHERTDPGGTGGVKSGFRRAHVFSLLRENLAR